VLTHQAAAFPVLKGGRWDDTQLVPKKWLDEAFTPRVRIDTDVEYGYQWYLINGRGGHRWRKSLLQLGTLLAYR